MLKNHYKKIWALIKSEEANLPARLAGKIPGTREMPKADRPKVLQAVKKLPHPDVASEADILGVLKEIYSGNLEWAFRLPYDGKLLGLVAHDFIT